MTQGTLRALGGSVALTIPKKLLESVGLGAGDRVSIAIESGCIVVGPAKRPRYRLPDLLAQCNPRARMTKAEREWLDAPPVGREVI